MTNSLKELEEKNKKALEVYEDILKYIREFGEEFIVAYLEGKIEGCKSFLKSIEEFKK